MELTRSQSGATDPTRSAELVEKARGDRDRIEALISRQSAEVRRMFVKFLRSVESRAARREIRRALERGDVEGALRIIDSYVIQLSGVLQGVFINSAESEVTALSAAIRREGRQIVVNVSFDPSSPRAAVAMDRNRLQFVREFTQAQRESSRSALSEALRVGAGPIQAARAFRGSIGLTEAQRRAVGTYRGLLERGDRAALERALRDRRFDSSVARAADEGVPLGAARIDRMVERYHQRFLQFRAETIARTETMRVLALARQEALRQTLEQTGLPATAVTRVWGATKDKRTRDTHREMDGQRRGVDEAFVSPSGVRLMYPGDPSAPAGEVIHCRCVVTHEFGAP